MSSRLLTREVSFGHANGADLKQLEILTRKLIPTCDGMSHYFAMVKQDVSHEHFPKTPIASRMNTPRSSRPGTPVHSRPPTRPPSPSHDANLEEKRVSLEEPRHDVRPSSHRSLSSVLLSRDRSGQPTPGAGAGHQHHSLFHNIMHRHSRTHSPDSSATSLHNRINGYFNVRADAAPVGMWESLRYAEVEAHIHPESADVHSEEMSE